MVMLTYPIIRATTFVVVVVACLHTTVLVCGEPSPSPLSAADKVPSALLSTYPALTVNLWKSFTESFNSPPPSLLSLTNSESLDRWKLLFTKRGGEVLDKLVGGISQQQPTTTSSSNSEDVAGDTTTTTTTTSSSHNNVVRDVVSSDEQTIASGISDDGSLTATGFAHVGSKQTTGPLLLLPLFSSYLSPSAAVLSSAAFGLLPQSPSTTESSHNKQQTPHRPNNNNANRVVVIYNSTPRMVRHSLSNLVSSALLTLQLSPLDLSSTHMTKKLQSLQRLQAVYLHSLQVEVVEVPPHFTTLEFLILLVASPFVEAAYPETAVVVPQPVEWNKHQEEGNAHHQTDQLPSDLSKRDSVTRTTTTDSGSGSGNGGGSRSGNGQQRQSLIPMDTEWMLNPPRLGLLPNDSLYQTQWYLRDFNLYSVKAEAAWSLLSEELAAQPRPPPRLVSHFRRRSAVGGAAAPTTRRSLGAEKSAPSSVLVAVLDTSCDFTHPDLKDRVWFNEAEGNCFDGIDGDGNGYIDDCYGWDFIESKPLKVDNEGHGTASAGLIAAEPNNHIGLAGLCWNCRVMCIKALTTDRSIVTSSAHILMAIDYAIRNGAKVSNNSWGSQGIIPELLVALARARQYGHLFVAAAGNSGVNNDDLFQAFFPASHLLDNVLSVGSIDFNGQKASFSNYGKKTVDVFSPGTALATTQPGTGYTMKSGTSYSAPLVTGIAGMIMSLFPAITYREVKQIIIQSVTPVEHLKEMSRSGGTINAYNALKQAVDYCASPDACTIHSRAAIMQSWTSMCYQPLLCALPSMDWETFWQWISDLPEQAQLLEQPLLPDQSAI
eukprot:GHVS01072474.1.p1 GENE.GHVS01072474.1~~GHVS01072474.1.p1  ORF type:complete len:828 (+),score=165.08 GHVS01072474.1:42-2525(+)